MSFDILLVDDDRQVRDAGRQTLELAGFRVRCLDSAEQALKALGRDCGVLVTDVRMPKMDGFALLERALILDPDLPVIMITGHGDISMAVRAIRGGAYDFLEKPYPNEILVDTVKRALERRRLVMENRRLREELARSGEGLIVGRSKAMDRLRTAIATVAETDADVLIMGETGTGKELVARALHQQSRRRGRPFVALNCGAMPEAIFESELFGHEAGSFTGAGRKRIGRITYADKGSLFLDEIESMPLFLQVKILRVLQERVVEPLGSNEQIPVDIRVVAATKTCLKAASAEGKFRQDLYYRLNVVLIEIPPLRDRKEDIPLLFQHFVTLAASRFGREPPPLPPDLVARLVSHSWPGNVRELRNAADRFVLGLDDGGISADGEAGTARLSLAEQVDQFERNLISHELALAGGNVKSAIEALQIPRKTFYDKLRRHGIVAEDYR
jgi:two-component system C4-dicarboxylate transport response regulator DctD